MKIINKDMISYNLHIIKTDIFKTVTMKVNFTSRFTKEDITKRNILSDILLQSSYDYKSRRELTIKSEELYATDIYITNNRIGKYLSSSFILQTLSDKYTENGNLEESIKFLSDIIFRPDINDNKFNDVKLEQSIHNQKVSLDSIKENASNYSVIRMLEAFDKDGVISTRMVGYKEDLDDINSSNLYEYYNIMIKNSYVDIYIVGDVDSKEITKIISKYFKFRIVKNKKDSYKLDIRNTRKRRLFARETINNNQSKLSIACNVDKLKKDEYYALLLGNIILGGGADAKLFKEVREKNSLCYTIYSRYNRIDNMIIINAGIDSCNYEKSLKLIEKNIFDMKKGNFTLKDISVAKELFDSACEGVYESPSKIISEVESNCCYDLEDIETRRLKISKITKKDIIKVFKKVNMDTVFLLEGVSE